MNFIPRLLLLLAAVIPLANYSMQKPTPPLDKNITPYITKALKEKDKATIDFYKQSRADDLAHYFDMEVTRYTNAIFKNQLQTVLKQAAEVDYKLPLGKYISYAVRNSNDPEVVKLLVTNADQTDSQFIKKEIDRLYKQATQTQSDFEKKRLTEQIAALIGYDLMISQHQTPQAAIKPIQKSAQEVYDELGLAILNKDVISAAKILNTPGFPLDINQAGGGGMTILEYAIATGSAPMVKLLLDHNANAKIPGLLHWVVKNGEPAIIELLVQHGADQERRKLDNTSPFKPEGETPLEIVEHELEMIGPNNPRKEKLEKTKQILEKAASIRR